MRFLLTPLLVLLLASCGRAQTMDVADFFALPYPDLATKSWAPKDFNAPWLENTEVRTETRDFDPASQRYTLRVSPSTPGKRKAQKALATHLDTRPDFDAEEERCDLLRQRYEDWLALYLLDEELRLNDRLDTVLADRRTVLDRMSASLDFDWSALVRLTTDRGDLALRQTRLRSERRALLATYGLDETTLDFSAFPAATELSFDPTASIATPIISETIYDLQEAMLELNLERAERRQYLDFLQAEYTGPHDDLFRERFSVGLGFQIPSDGNQKLKVRELQLEAFRLSQEAERDRDATLDRVAERRREFSAIRTLYGDINEVLAAENRELSAIADRISRRDGFDPLPLLALRERQLKNALRELDYRRDLLRAYLDAVNPTDICRDRAGELWRR